MTQGMWDMRTSKKNLKDTATSGRVRNEILCQDKWQSNFQKIKDKDEIQVTTWKKGQVNAKE